jgi:hypothetical protein
VRPVTKEQWQDAVNAADLLAHITTARILLFIEMGRLFGLIDENGEVDVAACQQIIEDARSQGVRPSTDATRQFTTDSY